MDQDRKWISLLVAFILCTIAIASLASYSVRGAERSGYLGTYYAVGYYTALAQAELGSGETLSFELEANHEFFFVVRDLDDITDSLGPEYYEGPFLLNMSGTEIDGEFEAPEDGTYVLQYFVTDAPDGFWFEVEYTFREITSADTVFFPLLQYLLPGLLAVSAGTMVAAWRWASKAGEQGTVFLRFWRLYASNPIYWVIPLAAAAVCVVAFELSPDPLERPLALSLALFISTQVVVLAIVIGLLVALILKPQSR